MGAGRVRSATPPLHYPARGGKTGFRGISSPARPLDDSHGDAWLILFDIDRFNAVNDTFGHSAGDDVIVAVAEVIRDTFADGEVCARIGSEEFAVLWSKDEAGTLAERAELVRQRVAALEVVSGERGVRITISGGIADLAGTRGFNEIFSEADQALYVAKAGGRNRIVRHRDIDSLSTGAIVLSPVAELAHSGRLAG